MLAYPFTPPIPSRKAAPMSTFLDAMKRATRATRDGNPLDATRVIRDALSGASAQDVQGAPVDDFDGVTIEGQAAPASEASKAAENGAIAPMLSQTYRGKAGARDYRLFLPPQAPEGVRGLVLMLHGCTQDPDDFARGTAMNDIAAREGLIVAYPHQMAQHNPNGCWNWFDPANQRRGSGEAAILAGLAQEVAQVHGVPHGAVFAAGLSAGGAMAAILGAEYADVFSAVGIHSGLAAGSAQDVGSAFAAMKGKGRSAAPVNTPAADHARVMVVHGRRDRTVVPSNGTQIYDSMDRSFHDAVQQREKEKTPGLARKRLVRPDATVVAEHWEITGLGHAWSGGNVAGSFTAPLKPGASEGFVRFFLNPKA